MKQLLIRGGRPLGGSVPIHGAKNSVLPILAACAAVAEPCTVENCSNIADVDTALSILQELGCRAEREGHTARVDASCLTSAQLPPDLMRQMRSSVLFLGPLLARTGCCRLSTPGGCVLGERPIDLHLRAMEQMGASVTMLGGEILCTAERLHGAVIYLPIPSVGATENILLAAMGTEEQVTIVHAAREPEIVDLARFLQAAGAKIEGAGTDIIQIRGGRLHGCTYAVMPDRIEAATYLACCACAGGNIRLERCEPNHLRPVLDALYQAGCQIGEEQNAITLMAQPLRAVPPIRTAPYPAFPTDAQALLMACMTTAQGSTVFVETVFSSRYRHVPALCQMGANICVGKQIAVVQGIRRLHGAEVQATDLRGGAALLAAALGAEGQSRISNLVHIARGYDSLVENLRQLGAEIFCIETPPREEYYESEPKTQCPLPQRA